jgi:hypothetical protein
MDGDCHLPYNFTRHWLAARGAIVEYQADGIFGHSNRFGLRITFSDDLWQRWHANYEAALLNIGFENHNKGSSFVHGDMPFHMFAMVRRKSCLSNEATNPPSRAAGAL